MKRLLWTITASTVALYGVPAWADGIPPQVVLSGPLVEEIGRILVSRPYSETAATISKIQAELQHQPMSPQVGPGPTVMQPPTPPAESKQHEHEVNIPKSEAK